MSITDKINVLDLIIEVLREHEKALDALEQRLEKALDRIEGQDEQRLMRRFYT